MRQIKNFIAVPNLIIMLFIYIRSAMLHYKNIDSLLILSIHLFSINDRKFVSVNFHKNYFAHFITNFVTICDIKTQSVFFYYGYYIYYWCCLLLITDAIYAVYGFNWTIYSMLCRIIFLTIIKK